MFFSSHLLKPYKSLNRLECSKLQRLKIHLRNLHRRMNHIHNERMYPSLHCLENLLLFQMKNYQTHYLLLMKMELMPYYMTLDRLMKIHLAWPKKTVFVGTSQLSERGTVGRGTFDDLNEWSFFYV